MNGRDHRYVTDAEWLADRLVQEIAAHVAAEEERTERARAARGAAAWLGLGVGLGAAVLLKIVFLLYGVLLLQKKIRRTGTIER